MEERALYCTYGSPGRPTKDERAQRMAFGKLKLDVDSESKTRLDSCVWHAIYHLETLRQISLLRCPLIPSIFLKLGRSLGRILHPQKFRRATSRVQLPQSKLHCHSTVSHHDWPQEPEMVGSWHQQWQAAISCPIASLKISMYLVSNSSRNHEA